MIATLLVAAAVGVAPAPAPSAPSIEVNSPDATVRAMECKLPDCVMVNAQDFNKLVQTNGRYFAAILQLQADLAEARKAKSCAIIDVLDPKRKP